MSQVVNQSVTEVFVQQPLASPRSANYMKVLYHNTEKLKNFINLYMGHG